jgi:hypothetical protein
VSGRAKGRAAGVRLDGRLEVVVGEGEHPAVGVMDQDDLAGAEQPLADGQGPDRVIGDHAARVADHVRLALGESEGRVNVQAGIHAGDNGHAAGGMGSGPLNSSAYCWLLASSSSVTDMARVSFPWSWRVAVEGLEHRSRPDSGATSR